MPPIPLVLLKSVWQLATLLLPAAAISATWSGGVVVEVLQLMAAFVPSVKVTVPVGFVGPAFGVTVAVSVTPLAAVAAVVNAVVVWVRAPILGAKVEPFVA